ncbi:MAG: polysaccharide biosynthesis tyrosine autokinase [Pseudomonadota bacterium]
MTVQSVQSRTGGDLADLAAAWSDQLPAGTRPIELRTILSTLWRRKWVLVFTMLLAVGGTWILLQKLPKQYTAGAEVMLNNRETTVVDIENVVSDLGGHDISANEQRVLTSERLLTGVIDRLRLDRDPEFNLALRPPGPLDQWKAEALTLLSNGPLAEYLNAGERVIDPAVERERERLSIIQTFREALRVAGVPFTRSITISVTSTNPAKAALIANTLADLYIVDQLETKFEATRRASSWLNQRIGELKQKVQASEAAVETFKADQTIGAGQGDDLTKQQIAELNTELISARAARAEANARYNQVQRRFTRGGVSAAASVVSSDLILTLRTQLAEMARREAELGTRYGDRHPKMLNVRAEIKDARAAISSEVRKIIEGLKNDVAVASAREAALKSSLEDLEVKSVAFSQSSVQLRQLQREADADRLIYENFLNRFRETSEQEDLQAADARILSGATPPLEPSAPKVKKVLLIAGAIGLVIGFGLILLLETLNNTFRVAAEVSERTGLPVLSALPQRGRRRKRRQMLDYIRNKPNSALAEAVRSLRTSLLLSNIDAPPQVVMVTSSVPGEGKSTTCLMLAHMSVQMNKRAVVVDCDIRRPTLGRSFGLDGGNGLVDVLDGTCDLDAAIVQDDATGLHLLPTIRPVPQAADILSSQKFRQLIDVLKARYDLVLLDTPPILAVSDAGAVGKLTDTTIYAVRWNHTPREATTRGLERLSELGVRVAGAVVTLVDRREEAIYSYGRYGYGYGYNTGSNAYYSN